MKSVEILSRHVAIYLPSLRGGGAERVMVTIANGLASRGHRVDLVLACADGPYLSEVSPAVKLVALNRARTIKSLLPLARYLRRAQPDAMLAALNHANIVAIIAHGLAGSKSRLVISERNSLRSLGTGRLFRWLMRRLYPKADAIIAVTKAGVQELTEELGLDPAKVLFIPNPVDTEHLQKIASARPDHPWLTPGQPPVILAVGRLEPQKDYLTLLSALARLREQQPVRLVILGEGSQRAFLEQKIAAAGLDDDVLLAGFQPNPFGWMGACAAYVMSSRYEGFPNSLVQAMACGARVISTDCPTGPFEILEGGKWGRLVPVGNADALARALQEVLADAESPASGARLASFRLDRIIQAYEKILV